MEHLRAMITALAMIEATREALALSLRISGCLLLASIVESAAGTVIVIACVMKILKYENYTDPFHNKVMVYLQEIDRLNSEK
jgi:hypothetical protein